MRRLLFIPLLLIAARVFAGDADMERRAVVWTGSCTAFVCESRTLVTAKHCGERQTLRVEIDGRPVTANLAVVGKGSDGPLVYLLPPGEWPSLPLAKSCPQVGDRVYTLGYPGGHWARIEGVMRGGNGKDQNYLELRINPGHSGGPLLNANGEVIGVATGVADDLQDNNSLFAGWRVTSEAVSAALRSVSERSPPANEEIEKKTTLVAFVAGDFYCAPCEQFKRDVASGVYKEYNVVFCSYLSRTHVWSAPEIYREFCSVAQPDYKELRFPTFWIRGTKFYKVGYGGRSGGLLQWIAAVVEKIGDLLIGERPRGFSPPGPPPQEAEPPKIVPVPEPDVPHGEQSPAPVPPVAPTPKEEASPFQRELSAKVESLESRFGTVRAEVDKLVRDAKAAIELANEFRDAGLIGKAARINNLVAAKNSLTEDVTSLKDQVEELKSDVTADPASYLWGLIGILTGLLRRRLES